MFDAALRARLERARDIVVEALVRERSDGAAWTGELSASALSTATAITALTLVARNDPGSAEWLRVLIQRGRTWLIEHQNSDGGWGDTVRSVSNISTTALAWAALALEPMTDERAVASDRAAADWLVRAAGSVEPSRLVQAIERRYGDDRTFSIPILTMCALCGRLGPGHQAWKHVRQLPFEVAALPQAWFGALQLPVVSYALPALIAIGQVRHGLRPTRNPVTRALRNRCRVRTLEKLEQLQPANGGFLEATPLTSFVTMSLAALGLNNNLVVQRGVAFIASSVRDDGSWPIDTNLATWVTTLSVNALPINDHRRQVVDWLIGQQFTTIHPYTLAAPGGWAWTNLPGGVPDADDTAGAILALLLLDRDSPRTRASVEAGVTWLLDLQNRDGGIPTFCRGWGKLPFDRSSADITAHAIRAWSAAGDFLPPTLRSRTNSALERALRFLLRNQRKDGSWVPLWFGNQEHPAEENPLYGTSRVLLALSTSADSSKSDVDTAIARALSWIIAAQNPDGGWSGATGAASSVEETGLAVEAVAAAFPGLAANTAQREHLRKALHGGATWLAAAVERGAWARPTPIGFYFAKLWYFERLYPLIFATAALTRITRLDRS